MDTSEAARRTWVDGVTLVKNVLIPMDDGVRLAADLYMPDPAPTEPLPVVLEYIPYRKDEVVPGSDYYGYLPRHGYIMARVDIRGTGASEGVSVDEYTPEEQDDGVRVVEWLAAQPFCDGQVNMIGNSYGGFTSLQIASRRPAHLKSVIPMFFTDDRYTDDCHYRGGHPRKYYDASAYGGMMVLRNQLPPYPEWSGGDWAGIWEQQLAGNEPYILKWLRNQTDGPYWRHGSVGEVVDQVECPVFMIGGWQDGYPNPNLRLYENLSSPKKIMIGPWIHAMPDVSVPGPRTDYLHEVVRWLDHWCKSRANGVMDEAPVTFFMQHSEPPVPDRLDLAGEWRAEIAWPPPGAGERTLHLGGGGALGDEPGPAGEDAFEYIPTVGVTGGLWSGGLPCALAGDQRMDEALSLVYTSEPLGEDLHILGNPHVTLHVSSTASVMGFCVSLADVAPNGVSQLVAKGMLNATRRNSLTDPEPLAPGEVYALQIPIDATAWRFEKGHRIRLAVASADWPNVWPTPELGTNHVHRGPGHLSCLRLPTIPEQPSATPPEYVASAAQVTRLRDRLRPPRWEITEDVVTGRKRMVTDSVAEYRVDETTVVEMVMSGESQVDPADPARASQRGHQEVRISRPNWFLEGTSEVLIQGTATHFHVTIDSRIDVNGVTHATKSWTESIPRVLL